MGHLAGQATAATTLLMYSEQTNVEGEHLIGTYTHMKHILHSSFPYLFAHCCRCPAPRTRSQYSATHALDPLPFTLYGGEVVVSIFGDEDDIFNAYSADRLVFCEDFVIDEWRVAHCDQQVRREVDAGLDGLFDCERRFIPRRTMRRLTTTIPSSRGSLSLKYLYSSSFPTSPSLMVLLISGLLALGTSCTSMPRLWPTPCGKNAVLTPLARIASSLKRLPPDGDEEGEWNIPRVWKPRTRTRWQIN